MPRRSFRDRFFTPPVARAITSPSGILLAGATASAGILVGLPVAGVIAVGAAAFAARVAVAIPRDTGTGPRIEPSALRDPWRRSVKDALDARHLFDNAVRSARSGPLRDRLVAIAARIDDGLDECWRIARQGQALSDARRQLDTDGAARELAQLTGESQPADSPVQRTIEALQAQVQSAQRMDKAIADTRDQLRLLGTRLDEAAARAIELSVKASDAADVSSLSDDVDGLVGDLEALRQGMEEADRPAAGTA